MKVERTKLQVRTHWVGIIRSEVTQACMLAGLWWFCGLILFFKEHLPEFMKVPL